MSRNVPHKILILFLCIFLPLCVWAQEASGGTMDGFLGIPFGTPVRESRTIARRNGWSKWYTITDKTNDASIILFHSFHAKYEGVRTNYMIAFFSRDRFAGAMVVFKKAVTDEQLALFAAQYTDSFSLTEADEEFFAQNEEEFTPAFDFSVFERLTPPRTGLEGERAEDFDGMEATEEPLVFAYYDEAHAVIMLATFRTNKRDFSGLGAMSPAHFH